MADSEIYRTQDGDMVDQIAADRFGKSSGSTEAILAANKGLADLGPKLPAGTVLVIPIPEVQDRQQSTRLWS